MAKSKIAAQAESLCAKLINDMGYDLVDVEFVKEGPDRFLRFYIDKCGGVGLDDCTEVSRSIDPLIDENLTIDQAYYLEVSSPGLDRPLKTDSDLLRHQGEKVEVTLYQARDGHKKFVGEIVAVDDGVLKLAVENMGVLSFTAAERAKVKQVITFD